MKADEFIGLVARLREAQKRYFKHRSSADLEYSKALEKQVDAAIREHADGPSLFGGEDDAA